MGSSPPFRRKRAWFSIPLFTYGGPVTTGWPPRFAYYALGQGHSAWNHGIEGAVEGKPSQPTP
jgi:hypothetical protein